MREKGVSQQCGGHLLSDDVELKQGNVRFELAKSINKVTAATTDQYTSMMIKDDVDDALLQD